MERTLIKVRVLQVDQDPKNVAELEAGITAGRTVERWQMPMGAGPGDIVIWYAAGRQQYVALGRWTPTRRRLRKVTDAIAARLLIWSGSSPWTARR